MKKLNLLKSILLAVALVGAVGGVKADTYKILYGEPTYDSDNNVIGVTPQGDFTGDPNSATINDFQDGNNNSSKFPIGGSVLYAKASKWSKNFDTPVVDGKVYFSGTYNLSANNSQTFKIVDSKGYVIYASSKESRNNGNLAVATICGEEIVSYVRQPRASGFGIKELCIDLDTKKITYEFIVSSGNGSVTNRNGTVDLPADVADVAGLSVEKTTYGASLDNVMLYNVVKDVQLYPYTINYTFGDNIVSTFNAKATEGESVAFEKAVTDASNQRYIVDNATTSGTISAQDNVFNVNVRKPYTAVLNVDYIVGNDKSQQSINLEETDDKECNWSYSYPICKLHNGIYYKADNTETFGEQGTFTDAETISKTVNYSVAEPDVVFYSEANDGLKSNLKYSDGTAGYVGAQNKRDRGISVGSLGKGVYNFEVSLVAANKRSLVLRQSTNDPIASVDTQDAVYGLKTAQFTLTDVTDNLWINGANSGNEKTNQSEDFDYVIIRKLADLTSVSSAKFATYSPSANVVVPADESGVKVYTAKYEDGKVNLTQVEAGKVLKAGTGYVIVGEEKSYEFALTSNEADAIAENNLKVAGADGVKATDDSKFYALAKRGDTVGFAKVAAGVTIPAGKCYLDLSGVANAKGSFYGFDGEATGISNLVNANTQNDEYYTLQGVKVAAPNKGVYIHNGKKVVVK